MARTHWRIDPEHPDGYAVPFTPEEEAQADLDAVAWQAREEAQVETANELLAALADWENADKDALLHTLVRIAARGLG